MEFINNNNKSTSSSSVPVVSLSNTTNSQPGSASGSFQNDGFLGSVEEFRQNNNNNNVAVVVEYYERHVFLCYKKPQVWPPHIEAAEFDRLPRLLSAALTSRKADITKQTRLTICEGHDGTESSNGDVLIFPDMIRYRRLTHFDIDTFVEEVLVKDGEWLPGNPEPLTGSFVFVCSHGSRDRRCGVCGPAVIARFKDEIELRGHQSKVSVRPCSHIGGHSYAGNVIIFGSNNSVKVTGHWYGYVMPDDVPALLEHHFEKGAFVNWLWRGQMGLSEEDQKNAHEINVIANGGKNMEKSVVDITSKTDDGCNTMGGCCQTNGTSTCCQSPFVSPEAAINYSLDTKLTAENKKLIKNQILVNLGNKTTPTSRKATMPTWLESLESEDIYAALALIGAAVSVAVAYNCYRQLALKISSAVTGRGGGGCGCRKQSISWRIRLRIGRHKKHKPIWLTSPVNAATTTDRPIVFDSCS